MKELRSVIGRINQSKQTGANWLHKLEDALVKKRGFAAHEQSHCHKHVVVCVVTIPATTRDVGELINEKYADEKAVSRQSLLKFLLNIRFLVRQALPMRGKRESNSNFNQLYHLRGEGNPFLMEWAKRKGSHNMQEEMVKVERLQRKLVVQNSTQSWPMSHPISQTPTSS